MPLWRQVVSERNGYFSPQEWYDRLDLGRTLKGAISAREADGIIRKLSFKSFAAKYKCVIVWLPETMNEEAANKILKILEEPWEKTLFVLVSERPDLLLPTILSRTQEVVVPRLTDEEVRAELERRGERDPEKIRTFTRLAAGDLIELEHLLRGEGDELRKDDFEFFCSLMRLSYNDKHLELMAWAEEVAQLSREQQRAFLTNAVRLCGRATCCMRDWAKSPACGVRRRSSAAISRRSSETRTSNRWSRRPNRRWPRSGKTGTRPSCSPISH